MYLDHVSANLCSLDGHAQFLHQTWLSRVLTLQRAPGCFKRKYKTEPNEAVFISNSIESQCDMHTTGVAANILAAAIRFIFEKNAV